MYGTHLYLRMPCIRQDKVRCKRYHWRRMTLGLYSLHTAPVDALHFAFTHTHTHTMRSQAAILDVLYLQTKIFSSQLHQLFSTDHTDVTETWALEQTLSRDLGLVRRFSRFWFRFRFWSRSTGLSVENPALFVISSLRFASTLTLSINK